MKTSRAALLISFFLLGASCKKSPVLATVNGEPVAQAQFDAFMKFKRIPAEDEKRREQALKDYLDRSALAALIEKEPGLDREAIQTELDEFKKEMLISRYVDQFLRDKVSDDAIKNYYDSHAAEYEQKQVHVAHILIRTNKSMSEVERKAKLTTAQEVHSHLLAGKDFAELADTYSEDRVSAKKGGDLGWLKEGSIDPQFSKRAFEQKAGAPSEPFETPFGFHVLKVLEEPKIVKKPFQSVAGDIRYQLREQAKQAELERLKVKAKIARKDPYKLTPGKPSSPGVAPGSPLAGHEPPPSPEWAQPPPSSARPNDAILGQIAPPHADVGSIALPSDTVPTAGKSPAPAASAPRGTARPEKKGRASSAPAERKAPAQP